MNSDYKAHADTFREFFKQFGELQEQDKIVLDVIFDLMYNSKGSNNESISLPGTAEQKGDQNSECVEHSTGDTCHTGA